jgi:hypothetical protein
MNADENLLMSNMDDHVGKLAVVFEEINDSFVSKGTFDENQLNLFRHKLLTLVDTLETYSGKKKLKAHVELLDKFI